MEYLRVGPAREWQLSQETVRPGEKLLPATQAICTSLNILLYLLKSYFCFNKHVVIILILLSLNSFDSIVAKFCFSSL